MALPTNLSQSQLRAALSSVAAASVRLQYGRRVPPPMSQSRLLPALAGSAPTLAALHGLRLAVDSMPPGLPPGLPAFTRLRALTLCQTRQRRALLRATQLPPSLEDLTLALTVPDVQRIGHAGPPLLVGFDGLCNLQRLTLADYGTSWQLCSRVDEEGASDPALLPLCLQVRLVPPSVLCVSHT